MTPEETREQIYLADPSYSVEAFQLKDHIISGDSNHWFVSVDRGDGRQFDNFEAAKALYDRVPEGYLVTLYLATRTGTAVIFYLKGVGDEA
jgi:hypothetical protein